MIIVITWSTILLSDVGLKFRLFVTTVRFSCHSVTDSPTFEFLSNCLAWKRAWATFPFEELHGGRGGWHLLLGRCRYEFDSQLDKFHSELVDWDTVNKHFHVAALHILSP